MKIINLESFRAMPEGTLFMKYEPCCFDDLRVKGETWEYDFLFESVTDEIDCSGSDEMFDILFKAQKDESISIKMDFDTSSRDGMFEPRQLFAVYEKEDIVGLIDKLNRCLVSAYK